ncbi:MAG: SPOR domain-containing protein, partial [Spirulina sp.]
LPLPNLGEETARETATDSQTPASKAIDNQIADFTRESTSENARSSEGSAPGGEIEAPQAYLASSEQLLRNVTEAEEQQPSEPKKGFNHRLLTPMGVSAVFVLGIAIALGGVTFFYPDLLTRLGRTTNRDGAETASQPVTTGSSPTATPQQSPLNLTGPNLATDEFTPVNPDSLSTVETNPNTQGSPALPTPNIASSPGTSSSPTTGSDLTTALLPPNLSQPDRPPAPPSVAPSPAPAPQPSPTPDPLLENAPAAPGRGDRFYYVVVDYAGAFSLQQARAIVPESYVRNFPQGAQIQMGAFSREREAKSLVARLEQRGVKATIYRRE